MIWLLACAAGALAQVKRWTWNVPDPTRSHVLHAVAVRSDGAAGVVLSRIPNEKDPGGYVLLMIQPDGKTAFTKALPSTDRLSELLGVRGPSRWSVSFMGNSLVVSDERTVKVYTLKDGKVTKKAFDHPNAILIGGPKFEGWISRDGRAGHYIESYDGGQGENIDAGYLDLKSLTLWQMR